MKEPVRLFRRSVMEDETQKYGLSLDEFLGGKTIPKSVEGNIAATFQGLDIGCQLILTGFIEGLPVIIRVDNSSVQKVDSFSAVGSGEYLATAALDQRRYRAGMRAEEAVYLIYEAKRFSERAEGINENTIMFIQEDPGNDVPAGMV